MMRKWSWTTQSDGPGLVKLNINYTGGSEMSTKEGLDAAVAELVAKLTEVTEGTNVPGGFHALPRAR